MKMNLNIAVCLFKSYPSWEKGEPKGKRAWGIPIFTCPNMRLTWIGVGTSFPNWEATTRFFWHSDASRFGYLAGGGRPFVFPPFGFDHSQKANVLRVRLNIKQEGLRRLWSMFPMFPLTRVPFWYRFWSHSLTLPQINLV